MSTGEHDPTRLYHEKRDALKEEQSIALAALRVRADPGSWDSG